MHLKKKLIAFVFDWILDLVQPSLLQNCILFSAMHGKKHPNFQFFWAPQRFRISATFHQKKNSFKENTGVYKVEYSPPPVGGE